MNAELPSRETMTGREARLAADMARSQMIVHAIILYDIGGMTAVLEGLRLVKAEVLRARRPGGWIL